MGQTTTQAKVKPSESAAKAKAKRALWFFIATILVGMINWALSSAFLTILKPVLDLIFTYYIVMAAWLAIKDSAAKLIFNLNEKSKAQQNDDAPTAIHHREVEDQYCNENYTFGDDAPDQEFPDSVVLDEKNAINTVFINGSCVASTTPEVPKLVQVQDVQNDEEYEYIYHSSRFVYGD